VIRQSGTLGIQDNYKFHKHPRKAEGKENTNRAKIVMVERVAKKTDGWSNGLNEQEFCPRHRLD
jgi:hypothetical protein